MTTHDAQLTADAVRQPLSVHSEIVHSTIEVHLCPEFSGAGRDSAAQGGVSA